MKCDEAGCADKNVMSSINEITEVNFSEVLKKGGSVQVIKEGVMTFIPYTDMQGLYEQPYTDIAIDVIASLAGACEHADLLSASLNFKEWLNGKGIDLVKEELVRRAATRTAKRLIKTGFALLNVYLTTADICSKLEHASFYEFYSNACEQAIANETGIVIIEYTIHTTGRNTLPATGRMCVEWTNYMRYYLDD